MPKIRFPLRQVRGELEPIISIGVKLGEVWKPIDVFVDTGATYSVFQAKLAQRANFDYRSGRAISIQVGNGALIPVFLHNLEIQLGSDRIGCIVGFSDRLGVPFNILGKASVFDHYTVCFQRSQSLITFENATDSVIEN